MVQEIDRFARNLFGVPKYKEAKNRLRALAQEMKREGSIPDSLGNGLSEEEQAYHHRFFDYYPERACIVVDEKVHTLPPIPNQLMLLFTRHPNRFIRTSQLVSLIWGDQYPPVDSVKQHVAKIRKALCVDGKKLDAIESAHSKGYRLVDPDKDLQK